MRYAIEFGCLIGVVSMCIVALTHVLYEMWRHGPYSESDSRSCASPQERNSPAMSGPVT